MARTATVVFDEYPDDEVVLRVAPVKTGDFFKVDGLLKSPSTAENHGAIHEAIVPFIESWTFAEDVSTDGLAELDINLVVAIAREWRNEVRDAPTPLPVRSSDGEPSEEPQA